MSEQKEQEALFRWRDTFVSRFPDLALLHASANGGKRDIITAVKLKRAGVTPGIPDIFLPAARMGYHGLWIEMKVGKNKPTEEQGKWIMALKKEGYAAGACWGWVEAAEQICIYLEIDKEKAGL